MRVDPADVRALRAALDETHSTFHQAITAMTAAAAALADLTVALAPLELAARRSAVDEKDGGGEEHE